MYSCIANKLDFELGSILWTCKLMLFYQLIKRKHETDHVDYLQNNLKEKRSSLSQNNISMRPKLASSSILMQNPYVYGQPNHRSVNAPIESLFGSIKTESLHYSQFKTRNMAKQVVFDYIEVFCNRVRRHAKIGNQIPADFAKQFYIHKQIAA